MTKVVHIPTVDSDEVIVYEDRIEHTSNDNIKNHKEIENTYDNELNRIRVLDLEKFVI